MPGERSWSEVLERVSNERLAKTGSAALHDSPLGVKSVVVCVLFAIQCGKHSFQSEQPISQPVHINFILGIEKALVHLHDPSRIYFR